MPLRRAAEAIKRKIEQGSQELLQNGLPADRLKNQAPGSTLPPTGNTGSGYTPGDGSVVTVKLVDNAVTLAKMQDISTDRLLGRDTAGTGDPEQLTVGGGVEFTGSGGIQRSALTGDVTASAGSNSTTIANDAVTYAKMQNVSAASKLLGRGDSGSGDPEEITLGTGLTMTGTTLSSSGGGGGAPTGATYITQTHDGTLSAEQALADLATGILKSTTTTGVLSIATGADLPTMVASGASHSGGAVPDPGASAGTVKFLREDASWQTPSGTGAPTSVPYVTTASDATLSAEVVIPGLAGSPDISGAAGGGTSEEYDTSTTGLTWTPSTPNTVDSNTTILSHLYIKSTDGTERFGTESWSPAGAFDTRCKIALGIQNSSVVCDISYLIGDSALSNYALLQFSGSPTALNYRVLAYTYNGSYTQRGNTWVIGGNEVYLRVSRDGSNNVSFWWSSNGKLWQLIATQAFTFTAAKRGWRISAASAATYEAAIDWKRSDV